MKRLVRSHCMNNLVIVPIFYNSYRIVCDVCVCTSEKIDDRKMFGKSRDFVRTEMSKILGVLDDRNDA